MMDDKHLLEMAAKAVGAEWDDVHYIWYSKDMSIGALWNPLTDDGDAFRLMVALGINLRPTRDSLGDRYMSAGYAVNEIRMDYLHERITNDELAATRRAIVRCAAEIGEGL